MFDLGPRELSGRLLDCSAGAADFAATASGPARLAVAVDPAYALPRAVLAETARAGVDRGHAIAAQFPDRFTWRWFGSPGQRSRLRQRAFARFVTDLVARPQ